MSAGSGKLAPVLIGYARVSTPDQKLDMQRDELKRAGCKKLFTDIASGATSTRAGRDEAITYARKGDVIVVWKLDRFGRSLADLIQTVHQLQERGVGFRSLHERIDTTTSGGRLVFHMFGALAEFERDLIRERTMAGLSAARARGRKGGRPPVLDEKKRALLHSLAKDHTNSLAVICATLGISKSSYYRYLAAGPPASKAKASSSPAPSTAARPVRAPRATNSTKSAAGRGRQLRNASKSPKSAKRRP
jgi:DNA invertase Pin-like site-specific DNA recombinase